MGGSAARRPKPWGLPTRGTLESLRPSSHVMAAEHPWVLSLGKLESLLPSRMPRFCDFFFFSLFSEVGPGPQEPDDDKVIVSTPRG